MTNYNERLDELEEQFLADYRNWNDGLWDYNGLDPKQKFHQSLTSLIKELVAEAKPNDFSNAAMTTDETNWYGAGYNHALEKFEQSLLKALSKEK